MGTIQYIRFIFNLIRLKNRADSVNLWNIKKKFRWECILKRLDLRISQSGQKAVFVESGR